MHIIVLNCTSIDYMLIYELKKCICSNMYKDFYNMYYFSSYKFLLFFRTITFLIYFQYTEIYFIYIKLFLLQIRTIFLKSLPWFLYMSRPWETWTLTKILNPNEYLNNEYKTKIKKVIFVHIFIVIYIKLK